MPPVKNTPSKRNHKATPYERPSQSTAGSAKGKINDAKPPQQSGGLLGTSGRLIYGALSWLWPWGGSKKEPIAAKDDDMLDFEYDSDFSWDLGSEFYSDDEDESKPKTPVVIQRKPDLEAIRAAEAAAAEAYKVAMENPEFRELMMKEAKEAEKNAKSSGNDDDKMPKRTASSSKGGKTPKQTASSSKGGKSPKETGSTQSDDKTPKRSGGRQTSKSPSKGGSRSKSKSR